MVRGSTIGGLMGFGAAGGVGVLRGGAPTCLDLV